MTWGSGRGNRWDSCRRRWSTCATCPGADMPGITITRLFGSGGGEVARRVAESLGWRLVDNALIDAVAKGLHKTPAAVQAIDERAPSLAERMADALALGGGEVVAASLGT